jgi:glycerophosphoryl diester phosphodiesterase
MTINYAHRGASGEYPENTMLAFEKAVEMGCTGIETDIHVTKDGRLVLIHDETVDRTADGKGYIKDYNLEDLKKLDAGSFKGEAFKGTAIPLLEELFEFVKDKNIKLNLELKTDVIWYDGIEEKVLDQVYKYNLKDRVIISSFNHYSVHRLKSLDNTIETGLLYAEGLFEPHLYAKIVGSEAIHPIYPAINNKELIGRVKQAGIKINTWTVNKEEDMRRLLSYGVEGIITNYPDKLNNIMKER